MLPSKTSTSFRIFRATIFFLLINLPGCESFNPQLATLAALDAVKAVTLSDSQIKEMSSQAAAAQDSSNKVAPSSNPYAQKLEKLIKNHQTLNGQPLNYKVYLSDSVNAFAMADGTIRVYSGLMDLMTDEELLFVIGHEIGHVHHGHTHTKAKVAYSTSAARKGVGALGGTMGQLALSDIGGISEKIVNAQFSQKEEKQADDYGLKFLQQNGYNPQAAVTALKKLGGGSGGLLSSHPDSADRAERINQKL